VCVCVYTACIVQFSVHLNKIIYYYVFIL